MTIKSDIVAKIAALATEKAALEAELAAGGTWLEKEWAALDTWVASLKAKMKGPTVPPVV